MCVCILCVVSVSVVCLTVFVFCVRVCVCLWHSFFCARVVSDSFDGGLCVHLDVLQTANAVCLLLLFFVLFFVLYLRFYLHLFAFI